MRHKIFLLLCLGCILVAGSYFRLALQRSAGIAPVDTPAVAASPALHAHPITTVSTPRRAAPRRRLLFCSTVAGHYGRLATVDLDASGQKSVQFHDPLDCLRVDYTGNNGICLHANMTTMGYPTEAIMFDNQFKARHAIPIAGIPSRTRVSPDGKWGAVTVFKRAESYADRQMSTQTMLIDMENGTILVDLEDYALWRDSRPFKERDFNFWGVTFTKDSRHFYATLGTGGKTFLIKGDLDTLQANVITEGIECPSLSPDNKRIAFKKRTPGLYITWRLSVLDLATLKETDLPEPRTIDQQVQWLDNQHVLYVLAEDERVIAGGPVDTWSIAADGKSAPKRILANADSPVIY